jgi:oxalate decarboxylase/phosphoglucose isomerase-like protein (cupin superfamily)
MFSLILLVATTLLPLINADAKTSGSRTYNPELNAALRTSATNFDRQLLLNRDDDWIYDFSAHANYLSHTGAVITADAASLPALTGAGISISLLKLAGCGMLPPHLHPRAVNLVTAFTGNTTTWMISENGARPVVTQLTPWKMTVFPAGSVHVMQNNGTFMFVLYFDQTHANDPSDCEPATLLSALSSDDAGTLNILPALWNMPADIIQAAFGQADLNTQDVGREIPLVGTGAIIGSAECKKRCGIKHGKE